MFRGFFFFIRHFSHSLQSQRAEGEALASDVLPPHHTRQARSAPAPPSGQLSNYNQAQDDADFRNSLSQLLARLISRKGENREQRGKASHALAISHASYFCLPISTQSFSSLFPPSAPLFIFLSSLRSILLQSPVTHAVS